ncbi:pyridoxine [Moniliophthora roreri MCA 2997]|uniref:glutaminase n=2 Tax=Moniliophthora roreri TaxID=221103 RepID=V2X527_MONRO|nr:pyridoxine [Moniliophthora roreri MCA 2997]KAI3607619.1 pyridoxine [Moniliophthora roreri]
MAVSTTYDISIGILALQGAFIEHEASIQRLNRRIRVIQVRTPEDLEKCDALIIPGGESTTIALLARLSGLLEPLRLFIKTKPVWGTCAGAILLSQSVIGAKKGGQELLGGMSIRIARNGWGSQVESFESPLETDGLHDAKKSFNGIFIRAPVILSLTNTTDDPPIQVVARLPLDRVPQSLIEQAGDANKDDTTIVAVRQGLHFLTTFHPELTKDDRFHEYFVRECVLGSR